MAEMMKRTMLMSFLVMLTSIYVTVAQQEGYFWHITDLHYDPTYWSEMRSCNGEVPDPGIYGDYWCDSPWKLVNDSINSMASIMKNVDFILWTGDSIAHVGDTYSNESYKLDIVEKVTAALKAVFPNVQVYPTLGNHDWYPTHQLSPTPHRLYNATAELWREWIDDDQLQNFRKGGYYTLKTNYGLRILGLNTNLYYTSDKQTADMTDPTGQFAWMETVLQNAKNAGEKVLVTGHVPPGINSPRNIMFFYKEYNVRFLDIIKAYSDNIIGLFFGHEHADAFKVITKHGGGPGVPLYVAPSITPWRYKKATGTGNPHNPGIRLVKYKSGNSLPLDILQYYMNLTDSNNKNASNWTLAYSTSKAYDMPDLSAISLDNVVKKMENNTVLLNKYIRYNTVLANGETTVDGCGTECRAIYFCSFTHLSRTSFDVCYDIFVDTSRSTRIHSSFVLFIVVMVIYWFLNA